ncbi:MAG: hypothetical protein LBK60_06365 [Verrucomicrobiales bacterium]|nr:hypothetical protein [Verrucomicrobiales bacterium]
MTEPLHKVYVGVEVVSAKLDLITSNSNILSALPVQIPNQPPSSAGCASCRRKSIWCARPPAPTIWPCCASAGSYAASRVNPE